MCFSSCPRTKTETRKRKKKHISFTKYVNAHFTRFVNLRILTLNRCGGGGGGGDNDGDCSAQNIC